MVRAFAHSAMGRRIDPSWVNPLSYFSFQPVLHDWCKKGRGMCYPVCGMVHIKEPLLLIGKSSLCGGSRFPFSLSQWSLTICLTPYNRKDHSDSERGNPLPPHRLLFPINSKGSFICTIPQTGLHIPRPLLHQSWSTGWNEK